MIRNRLLWEITRWELLRWFKLEDVIRTFVFSSLLGLAVWGGLALFAFYGAKPIAVGFLGPESMTIGLPASGELMIDQRRWLDESAAIAALERGEIDALLRIDSLEALGEAELTVLREPLWKPEIEAALTAMSRAHELAKLGLAPDRLADLDAEIEVTTVYHRGADPPTSFERKVTAGVLVVLMMLGVLTGVAYQFIVITGEKQLRVTEQVISAISPQMWIDGKILGISLLAFLSTATYIVSSLVFVAISQFFGGGLQIPLEVFDFGLWLQLALLSLAGFLMWNTFFGLVAATIDDPNTSARGGLMLLPVVPLAFAYFGLARPDTVLMQVLSILPPTSPILMPLRLAVMDVPLWQVTLAFGLLLGTTWLLRRAAGKVFAVGILMYGKEPSWKQTWRWIREV